MNAEIIIHGENNSKDVIPVQYNPSEYSVDISARYAEGDTLNAVKKRQFVGEESGSLTFKLTIDGFTKASTDDETKAADVSEDINKLKKLLEVDVKLHKPPECTFKWGTFQYRGVATKLNVRYTMFSAGGKPIRATADISITDSSEKRQALQSPDRTKRRVLSRHTDLFAVANEAYQDPGAWRQIAVANGIKNPRRVQTGMVLKIPPLETAP